MRKIALLLILLLGSTGAFAAQKDPMRLVVSPGARTWSLQQRVGTAWRTVLRDARVTATMADGTAVEWTAMRRAPDGRSFQMESGDVTVKVLALWLDPARLPGAVTMLPIVYAKRGGVRLGALTLAGGARLSTLSADAVALQDGFQSWDRTEVRPLHAGVPVTSWWFTAAHSQWQSCVAGYLSNVLGMNTLTLTRDASGVALDAASDMRRMDIPRVAGGTPLDPLYLSWGESPSTMLAEYAAGARVFTNVMDPAPSFKPQPVPEGWCSWYGFYGNVTAQNVLDQTAAAKERFGTKDFRYIQVDDGFQIAAGEWETNDKFPRGHRALTNAIHAQGYKAGLWVAPFAVGERSRVFKEHPEWLLRDKDGKLATLWGVNERWGGQLYSLDPSLQPARAWLRDLFRKITKEWGYDYIKIDFMYFPLNKAAVLAGPGTPVENYRKALKAMRLGAGPDAYILGCGTPIGPTIGLVNGNRIGPDVSTGWPGILDAARNVANRQWMHNVWWQNDPDTMVIRDPLTDAQAEAWTAAVALSGGLTLLSDDLTKVSPERAALSHMALPVSANGKAADFGLKPRPGARATGMRVADMWAARVSEAPALAGDGVSLSLMPDTPGVSAWKLRTGDDRAWAAPDAEDNSEDWRVIAPGAPWESLPGLDAYDGYGWYRVHFRLPAGARRQDLTLVLGHVDDADETFVNGEQIGATGQMPPDYKTGFRTFRRYTVPADALDWGGDNVLAIRVYDGAGNGGLTDLGATTPPSVWRLPSNVSPARLTVAGLFNWTDAAKSVDLTPSDLGAVKKGKRAHVWDVFRAEYLGATNGSLPLEEPAASVRLLSIAPDVGHPQLLGTDAAVTSGARDVMGVKWDARYHALKGRSRATPGRPFQVALTVPKGYTLFRLDVKGGASERQDSAPGSALFRITPEKPEVEWIARYAR